MEHRLNETDALVLSVIHECKQFNLVRWIGMIDFYERTVLSFEELSASLQKLQAFGWIRFSDGRFLFPPETEKLFPKNFHLRNHEKIYQKLLKKEPAEALDCKQILSEAEYIEALNQYRKAANGSRT